MGTLEQTKNEPKPKQTNYDLTIQGNYLIVREMVEAIGGVIGTDTGIKDEFEVDNGVNPVLRYPQTTEFQLRNVFFKTENDAFIIRDSTYRLILSFDSVERGFVTIEKNTINIFEFFHWLCLKTGSNNPPMNEGGIGVITEPKA